MHSQVKFKIFELSSVIIFKVKIGLTISMMNVPFVMFASLTVVIVSDNDMKTLPKLSILLILGMTSDPC